MASLKYMKKGYTLIELLTGITIFLMLVFSTTEIILLVFRSQKRILATREIIDAASFSIEYMSRAIRMAKRDDVKIRGNITNCLVQNEKNYEVENQKIKFRTYKVTDSECQSFFLTNGRILEEKIKTGSPVIQNYITPADLEVNNLKFIVQGDDVNDGLQPRVTIFLEIQKKGDPQTKISLQTTISQRDLDF